jgi:Tfp pilus assembly protein FimV
MRPKFAFAFERPALLQGDPSMVPPSSATSPVTQKNVIGLSVLFLVLAGIFGALNSHKVKALRANVANAEALRRAVGSRSVTQQRDLKTKETTATGEENKIAEAENKAAKAEAELAQLQKEKADLQTRLEANQSEIASLQKRVEEAEKAAKPSETPAAVAAAEAEKAAKPSETPAAASSATELQAQLDDARRQLDSAEKEKAFLSEKLQSAQERSAPPQEERKRRETGVRRTGVRGTVLAVNQAYNFVVLNLGARQGVEPNSEMLVLREGTLIGKIRISSVEPATAIGDIITGSLARGVQVQPGDTIIYAGTGS